MKVLLFLLSIIAFFAGVLVIDEAQTVMQEIIGSIGLLISVTLLVGAGVIEAVNRLTKEVQRQAAVEGRETTDCPYCAEEVLAAAIKCKHCGSELSPAES